MTLCAVQHYLLKRVGATQVRTDMLLPSPSLVCPITIFFGRLFSIIADDDLCVSMSNVQRVVHQQTHQLYHFLRETSTHNSADQAISLERGNTKAEYFSSKKY